ncbi:MAG: hypothetical protein NTW06_02780, partial [Candidatus Falkowbacteria bacterium]|nr:hypothetical protein [Candidatus Falkowbacteria bacterium]
ADSLSCDYYEDSGQRQKGWYGYCLEYDRRPGDPNACLLWYPVDRTKGNSTGDEMLSYEGRYPLYYAVRVGLQPVDASTDTVNGGCGLCWCACSPSGENCNDSSMDGGLPRGMHFTVDDLSIPSYFRQFLNKNFITSISFEGGRGSIDSSHAVGNDWCSAEMHDCGDGNCGNVSRATFDAAGNLTGMIAMRCDTSGDGDENRLDYSATVHLRVPFASRIVQVIDNVGNGSVWRQRIAANSNYFTICNDPANPANTFHCVYDSDYYPFGAVVGPVGEPPTWDSKPDGPTNNQPLYFEATSGTTPPYQFRAGQLHTNTDYLERLFTFPFASWSWSWIGGGTTHGQYNNDGSVTWDPPTAVCPSNPAGQPVRPVFNPAAATMPLQCIGLSGSSGNCLTCPGSTCDYCVVPPVVSNIHVNGKTSNIVISQSQSANLTFNSQVDAEQQPLEYVDIDWGDGDTHTEITGANLRDRPDETDPHSFYNVYNYVDIINRHVASGITCGSNCYGDGYCSRPDENVAYCLVKPRVRIQDNWGWFNTGGYIAYGNEVVVKGY